MKFFKFASLPRYLAGHKTTKHLLKAVSKGRRTFRESNIPKRSPLGAYADAKLFLHKEAPSVIKDIKPKNVNIKAEPLALQMVEKGRGIKKLVRELIGETPKS